MANKNLRPPKGGLFRDVIFQIRLVIRLMKDDRINPLLKILPFSGFLYFIFPDLLLGPIDDAAIILMGTYLFLELCPQQIVEEHRKALYSGRINQPDSTSDENVIDGEYRDLE